MKNLLRDPKAYQELAEQKKPRPNLAKNLFTAFVVGAPFAPRASSFKTST